MITSIRIIYIGIGYEALLHLKKGGMRILHSDTLEGILKEIKLVDVCNKEG